MAKPKKTITLETAFGVYIVDELLGEGGAGRVFGGISPDGAQIAVKVLSNGVTSDKRRRFKNEIAFLARTKHPNIISVIDTGIANQGDIVGPFYVMRRYDGNLRSLMKTNVSPQERLTIFGKILDGVEAAHLLKAIHRDLKPENILLDNASRIPVIADFGVASFTDDIVATTVETRPTQRLANFMYAAPEQRSPNRQVDARADVYALGLILNEMFTSEVPLGTDFRLISKDHPNFGYLDPVIARMLKQNPTERFESIAKLKAAIATHHSEFLSLQKISKIDSSVIPAGEVDEPLAYEPPQLIGADWNNGTLTLQLDRIATHNWIEVLKFHLGSHSFSMSAPPSAFHFDGQTARVRAPEHEAQSIINHFKEWLPQATHVLKFNLEAQLQQRKAELQEQLRRERVAEEQRLRVNKSLKI